MRPLRPSIVIIQSGNILLLSGNALTSAEPSYATQQLEDNKRNTIISFQTNR